MMTRVFGDLFLQYICASCLLWVPLLGQWDRVCTSEMTQTNGVCGDKLTEVLETICDGNYAAPMFKRSYAASEKRLSNVPDKLKDDLKQNFKDIVLSKKDAFSFLSKRQIYEQNIVCECCRYQCSFMELLGYCSDSFGFFYKKRGSLPALPAAKGTPLLTRITKTKALLQNKSPHE